MERGEEKKKGSIHLFPLLGELGKRISTSGRGGEPAEEVQLRKGRYVSHERVEYLGTSPLEKEKGDGCLYTVAFHAGEENHKGGKKRSLSNASPRSTTWKKRKKKRGKKKRLIVIK